ncbi:MAG: hypothetical protein ACRC1H_02205 [Caldilineaceae bacterium]
MSKELIELLRRCRPIVESEMALFGSMARHMSGGFDPQDVASADNTANAHWTLLKDIDAALAHPAQAVPLTDEAERPESYYREDDGCPTEGAVLRREWRAMRAEIDSLKAQPAQAVPRPFDQEPECWCHRCRDVLRLASRMIVCPTCGNKRCPHASDHALPCTGSNAPGQPGSVFAAPEVKP